MDTIRVLTIGPKAARVYGDFMRPVIKRYGLNQMGLDVLLFLGNNPANNTARDLCLIRGIRSGIASVAVENLIQSGYLNRTRDRHDRRIIRLEPTEAAQAVIAEGRAVQARFAAALSEGLSKEETEVYLRISHKILDTLDRLSQR